MKPTEHYRRGDLNRTGKVRLNHGSWEFSTGRLDFRRDRSCEESFDSFVRSLPDLPEAWVRIAGEHTARITMVLWMRTWIGSSTFLLLRSANWRSGACQCILTRTLKQPHQPTPGEHPCCSSPRLAQRGRARPRRLFKRWLRIVAVPLALYLLLVTVVYFRQRSMLFFPAHNAAPSTVLTPWSDGKRTIGYCREAPNAATVWLMMHGNAGQAADRDYVLSRMSDRDSLYVLEYPGYGLREGKPSMESMNRAASEAYQLLRTRNPNTAVCVLGESIGSGPACALAREKVPPDKIVLVVPFDSLVSVASERFFFLPVRLMLRDAWNNVETLRHYAGPVEIFGAANDAIIPIEHARALATKIPGAHFVAISGGHNDWSENKQLKIAR